MSHIAYVAQRYLFGKHRIPFIVFISRTAMIGMTLGVMTLMLALAVLRGFENVVTKKIIGFDTHIRIEKLFESGYDLEEDVLREIAEIPGVLQIFPIKRGELMLKANDMTEGALLEAMPLEAIRRLYSVSDNIRSSLPDNSGGILLGASLARDLEVETGDYILVYDLNSINQYNPLPSVSQQKVSGIYESGMEDYDKSYIYCNISTANEILEGEDSSDDYGIFLTGTEITDDVMSKIDDILPYSHLSISWKDRHQTLFNWMRTQQLPILIIFSLIMLVATVNIASTLILIILEKRKEIGTLRALGTSKAGIIWIFALEGLFIGGVGAAVGTALSFILGILQQHYELVHLPSEVYFMDTLAIQFSFLDTVIISAVVIMLSVISSVFPAWQASRLSPAKALRYE